MTLESENKIYNALMDFREEQATFNATFINEHSHIKKTMDEHTASIDELNAIKDRGVGALWFSGLIGGTGILAWLWTVVKGH